MSQERLIKKYANRRLYDASVSRHVTLDDIRELIIKGERVRVVEDKTGEDITRLILLQVIADQEQFGRPILSTTLLESIIRFYGNGLQEFMGRYLERSVEAFTQQQQSAQAQLAQLMQQAPVAAMAELARQNLEVWQQVQAAMFGGIKPSPGAPPPPAAPAPEPAAPAASRRPAAKRRARR
ncbi:MAG: polyhydroxyalkanoate synthesis repressor PhaR [Gammaproteobacteria bacterium]